MKMKRKALNCLTSLALIILVYSMMETSTVLGYSVTTPSLCSTCLQSTTANTYNKLCLSSENALFGYCCNITDTTDYCSSSSRYLCSDMAQTTSMKMWFCPMDPTMCFHSSPTESFIGAYPGKTLYVND